MSMPSNATPPAGATGKLEAAKWADLIPKSVTMADSLSDAESKQKWIELYRAAGLQTGSEEKKAAFRLWVYVTGCLNGTSRVGDYSGVDVLSDGTSVNASIIPRILGKSIRKFYRANMIESYHALKGSNAMVNYPRFLVRAAELGADAGEAFAIADWMTDCPEFTPRERSIHQKSFVVNISKARRVRDGQSLEQVEDGQLSSVVKANGADVNSVGRAPNVEF